jgi:uncharacterized Tic20 family protein
VKRFGVKNVLNLRNKLTFFDIVQLVVSLSGVCADIKIDVIDSSEYNIKCIDMFNNTSLEFFVVVYNPSLKSTLVKIMTMIQNAVREKEKQKEKQK